MTEFPISPSSSLAGTVPRTIPSSFDDVLAIVVRVEETLANRSLPVHSGSSLGALFAKVRRLQKKANSLDDGPWRRLFLQANEAVWIARAIEAALADVGEDADERVIKKELFHRIVRSQMGLSTRQQSLGKDALWELDLYRRIKLGGAPIRFAEPDLVVSLSPHFGDYAVACKKIYSREGVLETLQEACRQIREHGRPGVVAFNLDDLVPEADVWMEPDQVTLKSRLDAMNLSFISTNELDFAKAVESGGCDGIVVFTSVISEVPNIPLPISISRASAMWNKVASSVAKSRGQAFLDCLDRAAYR